MTVILYFGPWSSNDKPDHAANPHASDTHNCAIALTQINAKQTNINLSLNNAGDGDTNSANIQLYASGNGVYGPAVPNAIIHNPSCAIPGGTWNNQYVAPFSSISSPAWPNAHSPGGTVTWPPTGASVTWVNPNGNFLAPKSWNGWNLSMGYCIVATVQDPESEWTGPSAGNSADYSVDPCVAVCSQIVVSAGISAAITSNSNIAMAKHSLDTAPIPNADLILGYHAINVTAKPIKALLEVFAIDPEKDPNELRLMLLSEHIHRACLGGNYFEKPSVAVMLGNVKNVSRLQEVPSPDRIGNVQHLYGHVKPLKGTGIISESQFRELCQDR